MLLVGTPAICWSLEDLKRLDVDEAAAEGLRDALGSVDPDRSDNLDRNDQARGECEVHGRAAEHFFNLAKGAIARVERHRTRDEKLSLLVRHGVQCR